MPVPLRERDKSVLSHRVDASFDWGEVQLPRRCGLIELIRNVSSDEHARAERVVSGRVLAREEKERADLIA
jgi:hypothetical protein